MKKREFQKKTTAQLLKRLAAVCEELGENPNITVSSKFHSSYFKLRKGKQYFYRAGEFQPAGGNGKKAGRYRGLSSEGYIQAVAEKREIP